MNSPLSLRALRPQIGLLRSLVIYYGRPDRSQRLKRFYANFIQTGDLCFDIGAHVGARLHTWTRLGAHVVAVEPQPRFATWLRSTFARSNQVTVVEAAVAAKPGQLTLHISERTPTVSTVSSSWMEQVQQAKSFSDVHWDTATSVRATTLDHLIALYGSPAFCKLDIEGFEHEALLGLSHPLPALSIEYIPATRQVALDCIDRLSQLGTYRYNWTAGEQHKWQSDSWLAPDEMHHILAHMPDDASSGDLFARLQSTDPNAASKRTV